MKTTIEIDRELLETAREVLNAETIKETVETSLRTVVRQSRLQELADWLGKVPLELTAERLKTQRRKRTRDVSR